MHEASSHVLLLQLIESISKQQIQISDALGAYSPGAATEPLEYALKEREGLYMRLGRALFQAVSADEVGLFPITSEETAESADPPSHRVDEPLCLGHTRGTADILLPSPAPSPVTEQDVTTPLEPSIPAPEFSQEPCPANIEADEGFSLDEEMLQSLFKGGQGDGRVAKNSSSSFKHVMDAFGPPVHSQTKSDFSKQLWNLVRGTKKISWQIFSIGTQRIFLGLAVSRVRWLQEVFSEADSSENEQLDKVFQRLLWFSKEKQPGNVNGMSRRHCPKSLSWERDAAAWWAMAQATLEGADLKVIDHPLEISPVKMQSRSEGELIHTIEQMAEGTDKELREAIIAAIDGGLSLNSKRLLRLVCNRPSALKGSSKLKKLRRKVRQLHRDSGEERKEKRSTLPPSWPHWSVTRGKSGWIVGGDPREAARRRIQDFFEFSDLEWIEFGKDGKGVRCVENLVKSIHQGRESGIVIILGGFVKHLVTEKLVPVLKRNKTPWLIVDNGYGVEAIKRSIERR
jgi:hypothetical protein